MQGVVTVVTITVKQYTKNDFYINAKCDYMSTKVEYSKAAPG